MAQKIKALMKTELEYNYFAMQITFWYLYNPENDFCNTVLYFNLTSIGAFALARKPYQTGPLFTRRADNLGSHVRGVFRLSWVAFRGGTESYPV